MNVTSLNLVNPYIVGRPIYEPELFFGRRKLFRFIEDNLRQGVQVILLHGQRRIGKSSVLMQIPNFVGKDNFIFIYFDLHDKSNLPLSSILQNLAVAVNQKLDQLGLSSFTDEPFSTTLLEASLYESNYPKLFLNEFLPKVIDIVAQNNQKIVLLLDEFDVLNNQSSGSLTEQFFVYLQSLINQYSELFLIPVVGRRIEDLDNLKSLFKQAPNYEIDLLDTKIEARDLILKPVANSLKYEDDAVTAILSLTSGHAYLTQAVCYSLFLQAEEEEKSVITAADVKSIVEDAIELAEGGLAWFRDGLPISERVVFSAVAQAEKVADKDLDKAIEKPLKLLREYGVITTTALSKAPENLVQWGFLERVEDSEFRYKIKVKLVRYWLTKSYPLRQAIWELKDADLEAQKLFELATEVSEQRNLPLSNFYETILELNPNHFPALFKVSEVYLDIKDFEKSKDNYKRAYEVDPTRADEGYKLAQKRFFPIKRKSILMFFAIGLTSSSFMILTLFLLLIAPKYNELNRQLESVNRQLQSETPIMIDEVSGNFQFKSGSAELNPQLKNYIREKLIPAIEKTLKETEGRINFIQVIGHTDGQANNKVSNLDQKIQAIANGENNINILSPGSNADLGLMRALAVIQEIQKTKRFKNIKFRAYSAGQLYLSSGDLAPVNRGEDERRRRIEIRFIPHAR
jgi:outer membrane protein OmpA-like peptidoglycan-associated protein